MVDTIYRGPELVPPDWRHIKVTTNSYIVFLGKNNIRAMIREWRRRVEDLSRQISRSYANHAATLKETKDRFEAYIVRLEWLEQFADEKPVFPLQRSRDEWLHDIEELDVYSIHALRWRPSHICRYKRGDLMVCVKVGHFPPHTYNLRTRSGEWFGFQHPWILRRDEWVYLHDNPDYTKVWVESCTDMGIPALSELQYALIHHNRPSV